MRVRIQIPTPGVAEADLDAWFGSGIEQKAAQWQTSAQDDPGQAKGSQCFRGLSELDTPHVPIHNQQLSQTLPSKE